MRLHVFAGAVFLAAASCGSDGAVSECGDGVGLVNGTCADPHPPGYVQQHGLEARQSTSCAACHGPEYLLCITCHRSGGIGGSPHAPLGNSVATASADIGGGGNVPCRTCHG